MPVDVDLPARRFYWESGILLLLGCLFVIASQHYQWFRNLDRALYDSLMARLTAPMVDDIVIVAIDDASLYRFGPWPWPRDLQARLIQRINAQQPDLLGVDVIYGGTTPQDAALIASTQQVDTLALPLMIEKISSGQQHIEVLPAPDLLRNADLLGHVQVELDSDAIVRGTYLYQGVGSPRWPHLMATIAQFKDGTSQLHDCQDQQATGIGIAKCHPIRIPFAGPPGTYPTVSALQLLEPDQESLLHKALHGKMVLLGVTATGTGDWVTSPTSGDVGPMSGVEFNANLLSALLTGTAIHTPPGWMLALISILFVAACSLLLPRAGPKPMLLMAVALALAPILLTIGAMSTSWLHVPLAGTTIAVLLIYPIWSWRRHEIAWHFIQHELERIAQQSREWDTLSAKNLTDYESDARLGHLGELLRGPVRVSSDSSRGTHLQLRRDAPLNPAEQALLSDAQADFFKPAGLSTSRPGEVLAAQIRHLELAAREVREGRAIGLAGLRQMPNGALIVSAYGEIRFANDAAARLLQLDEYATKDALAVLEHLNPPLGLSWIEIARDVILYGKPANFETTTGNGTPVFVAVAPLPQDNVPYVPTWVLTLSDLTAVRAAEAQREEALAFLSHDIRSPLLSVLAMLRAAEEDTPLLQAIGRYTQKGLSTSEQFLQLSRLQLQHKFERYELELDQVLQNAMEQVFFLARDRQIDILAEGALVDHQDAEGVWVYGNGELLERAFVNLLSNAIKYSERNTRIRVALKLLPGQARIDIIDQGHGIPQQELDRIFDPYFRSSERKLAENRGAGLGLRFVKTVIERHDGSIHVDSEWGQGSAFSIHLPLHDSMPA